jgi:hypothetical protein
MRAPGRVLGDRERGSTTILVLVVLTALLAAGAVSVYLQLGNTRAVGMVRSSRVSTYCAEAGLASARSLLLNNYTAWNDILDPAKDDPSWYGPDGIHGEAGDDADGDDWVVTISDNDDEFPTPDPTHDNDLKILVHARCLMDPETPREIVEMIEYSARPDDYEGRCKGGQCVNDQTE